MGRFLYICMSVHPYVHTFIRTSPPHPCQPLASSLRPLTSSFQPPSSSIWSLASSLWSPASGLQPPASLVTATALLPSNKITSKYSRARVPLSITALSCLFFLFSLIFHTIQYSCYPMVDPLPPSLPLVWTPLGNKVLQKINKTQVAVSCALKFARFIIFPWF